MPLVLGLDVGTQGARAIVADESGNVVAHSSKPFDDRVLLPGGEQNPEGWWLAAEEALQDAIRAVTNAGFSARHIAAVAVDSTSGTIVPVDERGRPLMPAIMYNDARAHEEARLCNQAGSDLTSKLGYRFSASFGLPKILWIARNLPDLWGKTRRAIHAADFIVGKLTGDFGKSDNSNALKTGYDLADSCWPDFIANSLGIELDKLPEVVLPGQTIGQVSRQCAEATGLAQGTPVVAGVSDGTAGFVASGASKVGQWNSTIGTTLVVRGVSSRLISDPHGRIYCHRHPDGFYLPGGASNVGGECLDKLVPQRDYDALNAAAARIIPTSLLVYPLVRRGERLPFVDPEAEGFVTGDHTSREELYAAYLEGVAYVERWCLEMMEGLGAHVGEIVYSTGGGARSLEWMRIRASVLKRTVVRPKVTDAAMGAAVVAASHTIYSSLIEASERMIVPDVRIEPDDLLSRAYDERYLLFREECSRRGLGRKL